MTSEFTMDLRIETFHPWISDGGGPDTRKRDESKIVIGVLPMDSGYISTNYQAMAETVPTGQRDAAISRVVKSVIDGVLKRNEEKRSHE